MSIVKVIEVLSEGKTVEEAAENAVAEASKSVNNINQVFIRDTRAVVENNKVVKYRINAKISFVVNG